MTTQPPLPESAITQEPAPAVADGNAGERVYIASQWRLMWWKFCDHRLALVSLFALITLYLVAVFCEFFSPSDPRKRCAELSYCPPQSIHVFHQGGLRRPFVYPLIQHFSEETGKLAYSEDSSRPLPVRLFAAGDTYKIWGLLPARRHLIALDNGERLYLMGADRLGRDVFSRIVTGSRISLSVGLVGVFLSLVMGTLIGGVSGYLGGMVDTIIQRFIEILMSFPSIPLWLALSAAMPATWSQVRVYFCMTVILACINWTGLARVVRGKILALREEDYVMAAKVAGVKEFSILVRHLIPGFASHLIVTVTLAVPGMILAETSLSFLRLGLRPPTISWGVLLQDAMNLRAINLYPWLLWPGAFVIVTVLLFNFMGDGLRDAADPYSH
ncbi:MAG TPA: ABC transporter permease [Candidatus Brocadiia bacterium]|nr:ABC transporter permease [Candidatus Brocadiia bacterium]